VKSDKNKSFSLSVGASSLLMFFVILTLTTFATLSLVSANADYELSIKAVNASKKYYEADSRAEEMLAVVGDAIVSTKNSAAGKSDEEYYKMCMTSVSKIEGVEAYIEDGKKTPVVKYSVDMGNDQELVVMLSVNPLSEKESFFRRAWKVVNTEDWDLDDASLNLWLDDEENSFFLG